MKKLLTLALALMMVLSLAACGGKTDPAPSGTTDPGTSQQQPSSTPDDSKPSGGEEIPDDTSEPTDPSEWPDNEYTRLVPKPKTVTVTEMDLSDNYCAIATTWTIEETIEYAGQIKAAGFDQDVIEQSGTDVGVEMFTFTGTNTDGVEVMVVFTGGESGITIKKIL